MEILIGFISLVVLLSMVYFLILPLIISFGQWLVKNIFELRLPHNYLEPFPFFFVGIMVLIMIGTLLFLFIWVSKLLGSFLITKFIF